MGILKGQSTNECRTQNMLGRVKKHFFPDFWGVILDKVNFSDYRHFRKICDRRFKIKGRVSKCFTACYCYIFLVHLELVHSRQKLFSSLSSFPIFGQQTASFS